MLARLWRLVEGPEWADHLAAADPGDEYFERNLEAIRDLLRLDPFGYSFPLTDRPDDEDRIYGTEDYAAGYRVLVFFRVNRRDRACTLEWVTLEPLPED